MVSYRIHTIIRTLALALPVLLFSGCEVIAEADRMIPVSLPADTMGRGHVLVEFTGFRCVNCPKASEAAEVLQQTYGKQLTVVAMHPASNPFTQGKYDYTCEEADTYYQYMGGTATTPLPTGNIDFLPTGNNYLSDYSDWPTLIAAEMTKPQSVRLNVQAAAKAGQLTVQASYSAQVSQECRLVLWLVEDSVRGAQALPDGSVNTEYIHRHVLRSAISDPWGEPITARPIAATYPATAPLPENTGQGQLSVVAFLLDENKQVINARQTPIQ